MSKLWKRSDETDLKSRIVEMRAEECKITSPTVIFLTGFSTTNAQQGYIAGAIKRLEEVLGNGTADIYNRVKIRAWSHRSLKTVFNMAAYNTFPKHFVSQPSKKLAHDVLMPLVCDNLKLDAKGRATGDKISMEEAKSRLKNLTLFGYSMGTVLAQETYNATSKMMKQIGYNDQETKTLLNEVALVSVGNMSRPSKEKNRFTTLYLAATNDRLIKYRNVLWPSLREMLARWTKTLKIKYISRHSMYVASPVKKDMWEWKEDKQTGEKNLRMIDKLYPKWFLVQSHHELPLYTTSEDHENEFSRIAKYALTNAIRREEKIPVHEMLEPASPLLNPEQMPSSQEAETYKKRLTLAMQHKQFKKTVPQCK